jgi:integrase
MVTEAQETATGVVHDTLEQVRAVATDLITRHCVSSPTRVARNRRVLSLLLSHLSTFVPDRVKALPITLWPRDVKALHRRVVPTERHQLSPSAAARLGALAWLLHRLDEEGMLSVPPLRVPLQRARDLAVHLTEETFRDAALLASRLMPAWLRMLEEDRTAWDEEDLALRVAVALIWEGPILLRDAPSVLCGLRIADYDWGRGFLRLQPSDRRGRSSGGRSHTDPAHCPVRVFLRPLARVILNWYLLGRAASGTLDLHERDAFLFPPLSAEATGDRPAQLHRRVTAALSRLGGLEEQPIAPRRFIGAARSRALDTFPPIVVAALSGRLRSAPAPDFALEQLKDPAVRPVPRTAGTALAQPAAPEFGWGRNSCGADEPEPSWDEAAELTYCEVAHSVRAIQSQLGKREAEFPREKACVHAKRVLRRLEESLEAFSGAVPPMLVNLRLLLRWLIWQLEHPRGTRDLRVRNARRSVAIRLARVRQAFEPFLHDREVIELEEEGWIEATLDAMRTRSTPNAKKSVRASLKAFHRYLGVYESSPVRPVHPVDWSVRDLAVASELSEYPLLLPWEIETVRESFRALADTDCGDVLDIFTMLGAHAGLRRSEAGDLRLTDVHVGLETVVVVRASKTRSGRGRPLPLRWLLPRADLERFSAFYAKRLRETGGDPTRPFLASRQHPEGFDGKELARRVSSAFKDEIGKPVTFHSLRHSFASVFPLRWFAAFHGRDVSRSLGNMLKTELFSARTLSRFRKLFVSVGWRGSPVTTHPFLILPILMGHAGPELTVNVYVHTLDWFQRLYVDREILLGREPRLTVRQAAGATHRSVQTAHAWGRTSGMGSEEEELAGNGLDAPASNQRKVGRGEPFGRRCLRVPSSLVVHRQVERLIRLRSDRSRTERR